MSRLHDLYGRHIIENPRAQSVLLRGLNLGRRRLAGMRGLSGRLAARDGVPTNVYHATIQKTGTHWFKAIFEDPRVRAYSGLWSYPGHRYEWGEFVREFPPHHFVPALFMPYGLYEEIRKPGFYRTFYVTRDPRDVVVSWYFSARDTHRLVGKVAQYRPILKALSESDGITFGIETLAYTFSFMRSWAYAAPRDPNVLMVRFEDATAAPFETFRTIFDHCGIPIADAVLRDVLSTYTKEEMRRLDEERPFWRQRTADAEGSHYRPAPSSWRQVFTLAHHARFSEVNGDLLALLGYDQ